MGEWVVWAKLDKSQKLLLLLSSEVVLEVDFGCWESNPGLWYATRIVLSLAPGIYLIFLNMFLAPINFF